MAISGRSIKVATRAVMAAPFLVVAAWCWSAMAPEKMALFGQSVAESGFIKWDGGKIEIIHQFYGIQGLDQALRDATPVFAPSTLGFDTVSSWQFFQFLVDLTPMYMTWYLDSSRSMISWSPGYFPTLFAFIGQLMGVGVITPLYYFSCFVFGPSALDLALSPQRRSRPNHSLLLTLLILVFHTLPVVAMFTVHEMAARHYWTWLWMLSPIWIGFGNSILSRLGTKTSSFTALLLTSLISSGFWIYTVLNSPYSISTLLIPSGMDQEGILHVRKALQADQIGVIASMLLWLVYIFTELFLAGLASSSYLFYILIAPVTFLCIGPGAGLGLGWYLREQILKSAAKP